MSNLLRLLKYIIVIVVIGGIGFLVYWFGFREDPKSELLIEDTPIHIEAIRSIAEISTVNYKDEVVIDTVIYHKPTSGMDFFDMEKIYDQTFNAGIKRRLTLIVKGEVRFGFDLTKSNIAIRQTKDSIFIQLPPPKVLDVVVSPSKTEVFSEVGHWFDHEIKAMEFRAKSKLVSNAKRMVLNEKSERNMRTLIEQLIITDKKMVITFDQ